MKSSHYFSKLKAMICETMFPVIVLILRHILYLYAVFLHMHVSFYIPWFSVTHVGGQIY